MLFVSKKIITTFVLLSFLAMAFFGFASMTYGVNGDMQGNCPFSTTGTSLCPSTALPSVVHHLSAYQSFMSAALNLITVLLILVSVVFVFLFHSLLYRPIVPVSYSSPPFTSHNRKMQLAVMMAQMLRSGTSRPEMLSLADAIIESQSKEIQDMQSWYKSWYK